MKKRMISLFSGIGGFEKGLRNLKVETDIVNISEVDIYAIINYAKIHCNLNNNLEKYDDITLDTKKSFLVSLNLYKNYKPLNVATMKDEDIGILYTACRLTNNLGDVSKIRNEDLPHNIDLVTFGFPCQDLSVQGSQKGIKVGTRSGLLYEAERIIKETKPKYAIAENVKALVGKKFKNDFEKLLIRLESYGYNNYYKVLDANDFNVPQSRERIYIVSIRKDIDNGNFRFPEKIEQNTTVLDILDNVQERKVNSSLKKYFSEEYFETYGSNKGIVKLFDGNMQGYFNSDFSAKRIYSIHGSCPTLTTVNNHHFYEIGGRLTPLESFRLMGFDDKDYYEVINTTDSQLYKQTGNSVVVNVVQGILENLFKG